ncbi:MAG: type II toxin-antitoxin system YafQ family toxin [Helicobacter sp.]|nr:type II toxin-antitoxin system YafQ family toxin [Helicobacter sp.]
MKYNVKFAHAFKKSYRKLAQKEQDLMFELIDRLANNETLEEKHHDHKLKGEFLGYRECHIKPDLLLLYQKHDDILVLVCINVGSHSELF